jgi:hypothetical protein
MWNTANVELLKKLWASGMSAQQIAVEMSVTRSTICAKLSREKLKRRRASTAKPAIVKVPQRQVLAPPPQRQQLIHGRPVLPRVAEYSKPELRAQLAEAVRNTARL